MKLIPKDRTRCVSNYLLLTKHIKKHLKEEIFYINQSPVRDLAHNDLLRLVTLTALNIRQQKGKQKKMKQFCYRKINIVFRKHIYMKINFVNTMRNLKI